MYNDLIRKEDALKVISDAEYHVADDDWNDGFNSFSKEINRGIAYMPTVKAIEFPCKIGDKIYYTENSNIIEDEITQITIEYDKPYHYHIYVRCKDGFGIFDSSTIGTKVFLDRKSAETKLNEMRVLNNEQTNT